MVVTDLDGTLLNDRRKVSREEYSTLLELGRREIPRVIATGRSLFSVSKVLPDDFPVDYLIFSSGAGCLEWKKRELLFLTILMTSYGEQSVQYSAHGKQKEQLNTAE